MSLRCFSYTRLALRNNRFSPRATLCSAALSCRPVTAGPLPLCQSAIKSTLRRQAHRSYSSSGPMTDPSRAELFYHVLSPPTPISSVLPAFGLSFLPAPPPTVDSCAIIGWLPAASAGENQEAGLNDFKDNRAYRVYNSRMSDYNFRFCSCKLSSDPCYTKL